MTITVSTSGGSDEPPVPDFSVPTGSKAGQPVVFDGSPSQDDGKITKWYWEFGDGATAGTQKATHTYAATGSFEVTLWVTDDGGQQASVTKKIKIQLAASRNVRSARGRSGLWWSECQLCVGLRSQSRTRWPQASRRPA